jgi:hypothetical protein
MTPLAIEWCVKKHSGGARSGAFLYLHGLAIAQFMLI